MRRGKKTAAAMAATVALAWGAVPPVEAGEVFAPRIRWEAASLWGSLLSWLGMADDPRSRPDASSAGNPQGGVPTQTKSNSDEGSTINPDGTPKSSR